MTHQQPDLITPPIPGDRDSTTPDPRERIPRIGDPPLPDPQIPEIGDLPPEPDTPRPPRPEEEPRPRPERVAG